MLPAAVSGERVERAGRAGRLGIYVAGDGPPMLLVHSVNAAASAAEVRPLHERYAASHTVFTPDLPGFGISERGDRAYTPRLMTDALLDVLDFIRERCGDVPVDALAVSLGCEFLARAAAERPERFRTIALVSPTGLRGGRSLRAEAEATLGMGWFQSVLRGPGWGGALFRGLTKPGVVRYFLRRTWGGDGIDEEMARYAILTAREPGAQYAPLRFLSGYLFSADIHAVYDRLAMPVWASHGVRGDFTDYRQKSLYESRGNWRFTVFPTGALPYFEVPQPFFADYDGFLRSAAP
jgi:pimeloyl-ACP methyl ester carboxylesterase